jgi:hypothetical protein
MLTFIDGDLKLTTAFSGTVRDASAGMCIGAYSDGATKTFFFQGNIDEFRFSKGIARWTASFTPPTGAYTYVTLASCLTLQTLISGGAASTDNQIVRWDGTSGCWLQGSGGPTISDAGVLAVDHIAELTGSHGIVFDNLISALGSVFVRSPTGNDTVRISHDDSDAIFKTTDGSFIFRTDEGTNTNTYLDIWGKGTGDGYLRIYNMSGIGGDGLTLFHDGTYAKLTSSTGDIWLAAHVSVSGDVRPKTDNTNYLGKNSISTPLAWKAIIVKDTANGNYYRLEVTNGVPVATQIT